MAAEQPPPRPPTPGCPICGRPRDPRFRPFCSPACRDRDLLRWLKGEYAIPAVESEPDEDEGGGGPPER